MTQRLNVTLKTWNSLGKFKKYIGTKHTDMSFVNTILKWYKKHRKQIQNKQARQHQTEKQKQSAKRRQCT